MTKNTVNKSHKGFACMDCKKDTWNEYYMLYSRVWKKANPKMKGKLCISCLEKRLGRRLNKHDFTRQLINTMKEVRSRRLKDRMKK